MKQQIKAIIGKIKCFIYRVKTEGKVYLGNRIKFIGKNKIILGNNVTITSDNFICAHQEGKIRIGDGTSIGQYSRIASVNRIELGKDIITGPNIFIADYNHEYRDINVPIKNQGEHKIAGGGYKTLNTIIIGDGTWIGTNVVIVGNVNIGKNVVIGANSVVNKNVPDYCVVAGVPAKIIKRYDINKGKWIKMEK